MGFVNFPYSEIHQLQMYNSMCFDQHATKGRYIPLQYTDLTSFSYLLVAGEPFPVVVLFLACLREAMFHNSHINYIPTKVLGVLLLPPPHQHVCVCVCLLL